MTGEFAKKCSSAFLVDTFETVIGVEPLEGDKRAACDTWRCSIFFVKLHGEHLPDSDLC